MQERLSSAETGSRKDLWEDLGRDEDRIGNFEEVTRK